MKEKYLKNLEFYKIVEQAAQNCVCPEAADRLRAVQACGDPEEMRHALAMTDAMTVRYLRLGGRVCPGWRASWPRCSARKRAASSRWPSCCWWAAPAQL